MMSRRLCESQREPIQISVKHALNQVLRSERIDERRPQRDRALDHANDLDKATDCRWKLSETAVRTFDEPQQHGRTKTHSRGARAKLMNGCRASSD